MSACEARICPIGAASGGQPASLRIRAQLVEHLVDPVAGAVGPEVQVERGDEPRRQAVLGSACGDARRDRRDGLVADVLVDELRGAPERVDVDAGVEVERRECAGDRLAGHAVQRQRERVEGGGDQVGPGANRLQRRGERGAPGALAVEPDREPARLAHRADHLRRKARVQRAGGVVDQDAGGAELGEQARALGDRLGLVRAAGAVDEACVELSVGRRDRFGRLAEVRDVVQWVVQTEDVDAAVGRGGDEPADDVDADRPRADEEPAA